MSSYTIGETAERSGFSASALRYYEAIGLVEPASRTAAGNRLYDDQALDRLAFIARAKQLGCTLEEVSDLVAIWDGQRCGPVHRRLHELVTDKIRRARGQVVELTELTAQLQRTAAQLSGEPVDGPCAADCACFTVGPAEATAASGGSRPVDVPIACTLEPGSMADRIADWAAMLSTARRRVELDDGALRVELPADVDLAALAKLVAAEQRCCAFFSFALTVDQRGPALEIRSPEGAAGTVAELFGPVP